MSSDFPPDTVKEGKAAVRPMRQCVRDAFFEYTRRFEGFLPWIYLDVEGLATVGLGNLIAGHDDAGNRVPAIPPVLDWRDLNGLPVSHAAVLEEWHRIDALQNLKEMGGGAFRDHAKLRATEASMRALVDERLSEMWARLLTFFPAAPEWCADAQMGLLSIAWACGPSFSRRWPRFTAAALAQDWEAAADESRINEHGNPGVIPRNQAHRALFVCAAHTTTPEVLSTT